MNRFFTLLLAASCLTAVGQVPDYVPTDGLEGWWPFSGSLLDYSANEFHAVNFGSIFASDRFGMENSALDFDGDSWIEATIPQTPAWSISIWANQLNSGEYNGLVQHKNNCVRGGGWLFSLPEGSNNLRLAVNNCGECSTYTCSTDIDLVFSSDVEILSWHHCVASLSDDGVFRIYLDSNLIYEQVNDEVYETYGNQPFSVGKHHDGVTYLPLTGSADDVGLWSRALTDEEVSTLYNAAAPVAGCTDMDACNFDDEAVLDDGSCDYSCCPGPGCCHAGTIWDSEFQQCIVANPSDSNFDGCVQLNDLLDLLSAYGDCGAEESAWQCGDPLEYQGYDYETVQIGEQCWFAENLRAENYANGEEIVSNLNSSDWGAWSEGASTVLDNNAANLNLYGRLYNSHAVEDIRGLCPIGWTVPSDSDWMVLEVELGMSQEDASAIFLRGTDQGTSLKADDGWVAGGNGSNTSGFFALPGGTRDDDGSFSFGGEAGFWWSSTPVESSLWYRRLSYNEDGIYRYYVIEQPDGFSVRCIKD